MSTKIMPAAKHGDIFTRIADAIYEFERVTYLARAKTVVLGREAWIELQRHPICASGLRVDKAYAHTPPSFDGFAIVVEGEGNSVTVRGRQR